MLLPLSIFIGSGIYGISYFVASKMLKKGLYILLVFCYLYFIGGYLTQYYFEWSLYGAKYYSIAARDSTLFLLRKKHTNKDIFFANTNSFHIDITIFIV